MNHQIFISHAVEDRGAAERILDALERAGWRGWIAYRDMPPSAYWSETLFEAIKGSRVMVLLVSRAANASQYVIREVDAAVDGQVPIITVRMESVEPSRGLKFLIGSTQWLDAFASKDYEKLVVQGVQQVLGPPDKPAPPPPSPPGRPPVLNRSRLVAALLTVVAVGSLGALSVKAGWWPGSDARVLVIAGAEAQRIVGDTFRLRAELGGQVAPVRWRSSDVAVVSIAPGDSVFRAVGAGTALLHAEIGGRRDSVAVTVVLPVVATLRIESQLAIRVGETIPLRVHAEDQAQRVVSNAKPAWSSLTPNIIRVDGERGLAIGTRAGRGRVKAQIDTISAVAEIVVATAAVRQSPNNGTAGRGSTRDSLPRDTTTRNTAPNEAVLLGMANECITALKGKNRMWLTAQYHPAVASDHENLRKLTEELLRQPDYKMERHEVDTPGPQATAIDFRAWFSYRRFNGARGSANGAFRVSAERDGARWRVASCRVVNTLTVR